MSELQKPNRLSVGELAEREGVAVSTVWLWVEKGYAPTSYKIGRTRVFDVDDVVAWEQEQKAVTAR